MVIRSTGTKKDSRLDARLSTIRDHEPLTLAESSRKVFVEALLNPPKPNAKARAAARRFRQEIEPGSVRYLDRLRRSDD